MIATNFIARLIVGLASKITPGTLGVTIWPFIFIWPKKYRGKGSLIRHEKKHLEQWKRYWIVAFLPVYCYQFIKYGYEKMPLEQEARVAEKKLE